MTSAIHVASEAVWGMVSETPALPKLCAILDILTGLASLCIPIVLVVFVWKRRENTFNWLFLLFAALIAVSGITDLLDAIPTWAPVSLQAAEAARGVMMLLSVTTAVLLIYALPKLLALPNRAELSNENRALRRGILESERRFSEVADTAPARIWMTDVDGLLIYCNTQTEIFYGIPRCDLLGLNAPPRVHPEDFERCFKLWLDCFRRRVPIQAEFRQLRADGEWRWTNAHVVPRFAADGTFLGSIGLMVDVTERRAAEMALTEAKRLAEEANCAKDDFIAALSHELRTPLTPILMIARMLVDDPELSPEMVRTQVRVLLQNAQMEARLIDDLLDVARFARGKFSIQPERVSMDDLLRSTLETVREGILQKQLGIHINIAARCGVLTADPVRLRQVLWNLLKNAIKFTPEHGDVYVRVFNPDSERISVEVRDTGVGLAPEMLEKIFTPFEQGAAAGKAHFGGLGLGLAISKAIVDSHRGSITAASAGINSGATFTFSLPLGDLAEALPAEPVHEPVSRLGPLRILLVEDNDDTRVLLARLLEREGHQVQAVSSCLEAFSGIENATLEPFNALISDLDLPDGDGFEVVRRIKAKDPRTMGIALSGYGAAEDIRKSLDSGFDAHLTKPIEMQELRELLST